MSSVVIVNICIFLQIDSLGQLSPSVRNERKNAQCIALSLVEYIERESEQQTERERERETET